MGLTGAQAERGADRGALEERGADGVGQGLKELGGCPGRTVGTEGSRRGALLPWGLLLEQGGRMISCQGGGVRRVCLLLIYFNMGPGRVTEPSPSP